MSHENGQTGHCSNANKLQSWELDRKDVLQTFSSFVVTANQNGTGVNIARSLQRLKFGLQKNYLQVRS